MSRGRLARRDARRGPTGGLGSRLLLVLFIVLIVASGWAVIAYRGPGPATRPIDIVLPRGSGVSGIARQLHDAGAIRSRALFIVAAKLTAAGRTLKAGEYEIGPHESMARILSDIRNGRVVRHLVSVPEGWTSEMATDAVDRMPVLVGTVQPPPEGTILPDTYQVERGETRAHVIERMREAQDKLMAQLWPQRAPNLPFKTPMEAITLASIVEKETAIPAERPRIAAVYINRLRAGMRLESDPAVIYGVSHGWPLRRGLTRTELETVTPYNTYLVSGLPPTPIGNPGRASIEAVLNPPSTNELFFVANGQGGHVFSSTFAEHEKNVARWREIERQRTAQAGTK